MQTQSKRFRFAFVNTSIFTIKYTKFNQMQIIRPEIIEKLKNNSKAKSRLAYEFSRHITSIDRWLDDNNMMLTTPMGLKAIAEELDLKKSELLTEA